MNTLVLMKVIYAGNILVAGWISITSIFWPRAALATVFSHNFAYSEAIRLVGALWGAIFLLSVSGLFFPRQMSLIFLFQLIYKLAWLLFAALPALLTNQPFPKGMAVFFVVWVLILPFAIPWSELFSR